jgi:hypothetical protein
MPIAKRIHSCSAEPAPVADRLISPVSTSVSTQETSPFLVDNNLRASEDDIDSFSFCTHARPWGQRVANSGGLTAVRASGSGRWQRGYKAILMMVRWVNSSSTSSLQHPDGSGRSFA